MTSMKIYRENNKHLRITWRRFGSGIEKKLLSGENKSGSAFWVLSVWLPIIAMAQRRVT